MSTSQLKRLSLHDRLEIQNVVVSYAMLLDLQNIEDFVKLFVGSAVLNLPEVTLRGAQQIKAYFRTPGVQSWHKERLHHTDSVWAHARDWDCVVRSNYFETEWDATTGRPVLATSGVFEDLIVHCKEGWRFSSRTFHSQDPAALRHMRNLL